MNKKQNKKGYLAIEAVVVSAVVLLAGIASLMPFSSRMLDARTKLMGVFGDSLVGDEQLNDDRFTDVIRSGDFEFLDLGNSYRVITYLNELNKAVIIPGEHNGKEVTEIGG